MDNLDSTKIWENSLHKYRLISTGVEVDKGTLINELFQLVVFYHNNKRGNIYDLFALDMLGILGVTAKVIGDDVIMFTEP